MAYNLFKNGLFGSVPFAGDAYSFYFKSNAVNTTLILRAVKHGEEDSCPLTTHPLTIQDVIGLPILILPTIALVTYVSFWFWDHTISYLSILISQFLPALGRIRNGSGLVGWLIESWQPLTSFHESGLHGGGNFPR